jgi:hypothetical protein
LVGSEESQLAGNEEAVVRRRWGEVERERVGVAASEQWKKRKETGVEVSTRHQGLFA